MAIIQRLNQFALQATRRGDLVVMALLMLAIVMIVIPLPTFLLDLLIGINIGISLLVLIVALYVRQPVEFSSLPSVILLATLFRLSLSISTARLVLLQADAGHVVATFGHFVIGGQLAVGMIVFLIITVAQFLVITKGAERVAEVAARFILDAMPGKQMSIDNELKSGDIDAAEAKHKRETLQRESHLFGAMDGAMKFVKGDSIASLVILFVNLVGGLLIGVLSMGMPFTEAISTYSLLTVGDGLIAQIPALMVSVAAGTIVTRVGSENDLGSEIINQLGANSQALLLSALVLTILALIPGMPAVIFLTLAVVFAGLAFWVRKRLKADTTTDSDDAPDTETAPVASDQQPDVRAYRTVLELHGTIFTPPLLDAIRQQVLSHQRELENQLGIGFPDVHVHYSGDAMPAGFVIRLDEVPVSRGEIPPNQLLMNDAAFAIDILDLNVATRPPLFGAKQQHWVAADAREILEDAGVGYIDIDEVLALCVNHVLRRYASDFVGLQETRRLLGLEHEAHPELVDELLNWLPIQRISEIFKTLASGGVPLRPMRQLLEALISWGHADEKNSVIVDRVRVELARQICNYYATANRTLPAWVMTRQSESLLRDNKLAQEKGINPLNELRDWFSRHVQKLDDTMMPVVVISEDLRSSLQDWLHYSSFDMIVLSWKEIAPEFDFQPLERISLGQLEHSPQQKGEHHFETSQRH
ncbi:type III secretion system export apparatus subunit SctV [Carnimonas bestiolae]|uniref:type III secretion system export apparatus subunit SctV n=1 Tax=Carnimonas bestiolae TaxID=3402172 RepID=UPI003EDBB87B